MGCVPTVEADDNPAITQAKRGRSSLVAIQRDLAIHVTELFERIGTRPRGPEFHARDANPRRPLCGKAGLLLMAAKGRRFEASAPFFAQPWSC